MSNAVEKAKAIRGAGCSCIGLILFAPFMALGLVVLWAIFKNLWGWDNS